MKKPITSTFALPGYWPSLLCGLIFGAGVGAWISNGIVRNAWVVFAWGLIAGTGFALMSAMWNHSKRSNLWPPCVLAGFFIFSGISSLRTYRLQGFVLGKNTAYHGTEAIIVSVGEMVFGAFIVAVALWSHFKEGNPNQK